MCIMDVVGYLIRFLPVYVNQGSKMGLVLIIFLYEIITDYISFYRKYVNSRLSKSIIWISSLSKFGKKCHFQIFRINNHWMLSNLSLFTNTINNTPNKLFAGIRCLIPKVLSAESIFGIWILSLRPKWKYAKFKSVKL